MSENEIKLWYVQLAPDTGAYWPSLLIIGAEEANEIPLVDGDGRAIGTGLVMFADGECVGKFMSPVAAYGTSSPPLPNPPKKEKPAPSAEELEKLWGPDTPEA